MLEFIFNPGNIDLDYMGDYGYEDEDIFRNEVINRAGHEIVSITKECHGYYNLKFADGHTLDAISAQCIELREGLLEPIKLT